MSEILVSQLKHFTGIDLPLLNSLELYILVDCYLPSRDATKHSINISFRKFIFFLQSVNDPINGMISKYNNIYIKMFRKIKFL